ncbi:MAG: DUF47 domain-containing protein [Candidatus Dormibacteria bacterium]
MSDGPPPQGNQDAPERLEIRDEAGSIPEADHPGQVPTGPRPRRRRWPVGRWDWRRTRLRYGLERRAGGELARLLGEHLEVLAAMIRLALALTAAEIDARAAYAEAKMLEVQADDWRIALIAALATSLVTPIDREDLYRLSRGIDDMVDNLRDFVREWVLYRPPSTASFNRILRSLEGGVADLRSAVGLLGGPREPVAMSALGAKRACNHVRRRYQTSLAQLFQGELTMDTLRSRELLRRLDVVGLRLGETVDVLLDAAIKRS